MNTNLDAANQPPPFNEHPITDSGGQVAPSAPPLRDGTASAAAISIPPLSDEHLELLQTQFTLYGGSPKENDRQRISLLQFLVGIKFGHWKEEIARYRSTPYLTDGHFALHGVIFASDVSEGVPPEYVTVNLGLMGVFFDLKDHPGMTAADIMAFIVGDAHVVACWKPINGNGIEAIVRIPPHRDPIGTNREAHRRSFDTVQGYFGKHGLKMNLDSALFPHRLCAVSHDPEIWINPNPVLPVGAQIAETDDDEDSNPFPMHCLPGVAGEVAKEIARVTTSGNEALAGVSVLGVLSASLGAGVQFHNGGERRTRGNLFILPIAESGTGKGEAFDLAAAPLIDAEKAAIDSFNRDQLPKLKAELNVISSQVKVLTRKAGKESDPEVRAELLAQLQSAEREKSELERQMASAPRCIVADATKEKLAVLMQGQAGEALASMTSEGRGVIEVVQGRYSRGSGDEDLYCSAYSGDSYNVDRITRETVSLKSPCLALTWMVQPDVIRAALGKTSMTESGLLPRFLMFDANAEPKIRLESPAPIPPHVKESWAELIRSLLAKYRMQTGQPLSVTVTPDALRILTEYENENVERRQSTGDLNDLAPYVARWAENASKMALVIHCALHGNQAHTNELDRDCVEKAVKLMRWFSGKQLSLLNPARRELLEERRSDIMEILRFGDKSIRELTRSHGFKKGEIERIQAKFPTAFRIIYVKPPGGGRPSHVVSMFPSLANLEEMRTRR